MDEERFQIELHGEITPNDGTSTATVEFTYIERNCSLASVQRFEKMISNFAPARIDEAGKER